MFFGLRLKIGAGIFDACYQASLFRSRLRLAQVIIVIACVVVGGAGLDLNGALGDRADKVHVVADEDNRAGVTLQRADQCIDTRHVEVGGRLVEQQQIGGREQQLNQREAALFPSAKYFDRLEHVFAAKQERTEDAAHFLLVHARFDPLHSLVQHAALEVEHVHALLREIADADVVAEFAGAALDRDITGEDFE